MHRNMSSSKRSRSSSETPTDLGLHELPPQQPTARDHVFDGLNKMPVFLQQSPSGGCSGNFTTYNLASMIY